MSTAGIILLGLLRTPLRWTGAAAVVLSLVWALATPRPDILIAGDGRSVGVRGTDGRLHVMRSAKDSFLVKEWLAADADARPAEDASLAEGVSCDEAGCVAQTAGGLYVTLALRPEALADDCARAAVIVTSRQAPADCAALVIDRDQLQKRGTMLLRPARGGFAINAAKPKGTDRPWSPAAAGDSETETTPTPRPAAARPADATPAEADQQMED
jgi:competence protein ComEC